MHEAGAAVLRVAPEKFWDFSAVLYNRQSEFFDVAVVNETRNNTYRRLAKVAAEAGVNEKQVFDLLTVDESPAGKEDLNSGNGVTNDIKRMVKVGGRTVC